MFLSFGQSHAGWAAVVLTRSHIALIRIWPWDQNIQLEIDAYHSWYVPAGQEWWHHMVGIGHLLLLPCTMVLKFISTIIGMPRYVYYCSTVMEAPDTIQPPDSPVPYITTPHLVTFSDIFHLSHRL